MRKEAKILYIYDPEDHSSRILAETLREALTGWDITLTGAKLTTLLFEARKYNVVHLFMPATARASQYVRRFSGKLKIIQTVLAAPKDAQDYKNLNSCDRAIVFCENDQKVIESMHPGISVTTIPPTVNLPDINILQHSAELRAKFEVGERLLTVGLNDISHKQHFDSYLYVIREYNRRGDFRLVIPRFCTDFETLQWRKKLQNQIDLENLHSTTLLNDDTDLHSLLDSADMVIHVRKDRDDHFDFPLPMVEAMLIGKPVLCFDIPPYNMAIKDFLKSWACNNTEDFIRESRDIRSKATQLEQISTELARYARSIFSKERVASLHRTMYENILSREDVRVS